MYIHTTYLGWFTLPTLISWLRGTVVECRSLTGKLSLSCTRSAADRWPFIWVHPPLQVSQPGRLILSSFRGWYKSSWMQLDVCHLSRWSRHLVNAYEVKAGINVIAGKTVWFISEHLECEVRRYYKKAPYSLNTLTFIFLTKVPNKLRIAPKM